MKNKLLVIFLVVLVCFTALSVSVMATETDSELEAKIASFEGKKVSLIGDSISTYKDVSNNTSYNSTIGNNAVYYTPGRLGIELEDTWWQQVIDALGMELLVNNSWSGSTIFPPHKGEGSQGYLTRCVNLHNDTTGEKPDVIWVYLGTNDYSSAYIDIVGTAADIDYAALIKEENGVYSYTEPTTVCEAYAVMLHKMKVTYPDAEIYCMTLLPKRSTALAGQPTVFNGYLKEIATYMNCTLIDLENCGIRTDVEDFDTYIADHGLHPGPKGMDMISKTVLSAMLEVPQHGITNNLQSTSTNNSVYYVTDGGSYSSTISLDEGYAGTDIKVTMGDEDITASAVSGNNVNIASVTGDVRIYATGTRDGMSSRFEMVDGTLASVTTDGNSENKLTLTSGSVSDGVLNNAIYDIEKDIILKHDKKWVIEWKGSGVWSGMLLSSNATAGVVDAPYIFKTSNTTTQLLAFGGYITQKYHNYGIPLASFNIDFSESHTYRLENRIAADGTNTVYLLLDSAELGAMTQHYISSDESQSENVNYANGMDFYFKSIGTDAHPVNGIALEYLQIWEEGDPDAVENPEPTIISTGTQYHPTNTTTVQFTWTLDSEGTLTFYKGNSTALQTASNGTTIYRDVEYWRAETSEGQTEINENLVKTIVVSDGFTYIRNQHRAPRVVFGSWPNLEKIIIPSSVYFVQNYTYDEGFFERNSKLTTISHSGTSENNREGVINLEKVTRVDGKSGDMPNFYRMFFNCTAIKEVILPAKNTSTSFTLKTNQMFYGCTSLEKVNIPAWMTAIHKQMFYNCTSLETLTFPATVESIAADALTGCTGLKTITIESTTLDISGLTIPDNEGLVINCASKDQKTAIEAMGLTNVTANYELPKANLMSDGSGYQYTYDEGIFTVITATTTASTVLECDVELDFTADVTTVIITEDTGITSISANMFDGWNASVVVIPSTLTTVSAKAFANMPSLKTVVDYTAYTADNTAGDGVINLLTVTSVAMDAFSGSSSALSPVVYFGKSAAFTGETFDFFAEDATRTFCVYPTNKVTTYFRNNDIDFEYLTVEQSGDQYLAREMTLSNGNYGWSFDIETGTLNIIEGDTNNFDVGEGLVGWPEWKAVWKDTIEYFYVANSITGYIYYQKNDAPFSNLPNLKHVHMGGIKTIRRSTWGTNGLFQNCPSLTTVSYGSDNTYDEVIDLTWWTKNDKAMYGMLYGCTSAKEVILPTNLAKYTDTSASVGIYDNFFYNCKSLVNIVVPDCFLSIGKNAFYGCSSLEEVKILNNNISVSSVTATSFPAETNIIVYSKSAAETLIGLGLNVVDLTNPITAKGFNIRYVDYNGLRALFTFDEAQNKVYEENGYTLVEYGVIAAAATDYKYWGGITLKNRFGEYVTEATAIKKMPVYKNGAIVGKTLSSSVAGETVDFAGSVVNYTANHTRDLYLGAYTVYTDESGAEYIHQICYSDAEGNNVFNLYDITLDMFKNYEQSGILDADIDEKAVWNTLLQGADTDVRELAVGENEGVTLTLVKESAGSSTYVPLVRSEKGVPVTDAIISEAEALISAEITLAESGTIGISVADQGTTAPEFSESMVYTPTIETPNKYPRYKTPDSSVIYGAQHPQGMTMDDRGNVYISFTGLIVKINQKSEEVGVYKLSDEMISISTHIGNLYWHEGKIYIGLGISNTTYSSHKRYIGVLDESVFNDYGGYVQDNDADPLLHALNIPELSVDRTMVDSNGTTFSKFGGGGIDGITVGKLPGKGYILPAGYVVKEDVKASNGTVYKAGTVLTQDVEVTDNEDYIVAVRTQGSYDTYRYDDDYKQVMVFDFDDITEENLLPMSKERVGKDDPTGIYIKYNMFVYNGYHEYGTQVICHDKNTGDYQLWTYGRASTNNEFPDGSFYVIDGSKKLRLEEIEVGQSVPEDSEMYAVASDRASLYVDEKDLDNDGDTSERLIGWVASLKCICGNHSDIEEHEAVVYGETGYPAKICGMLTTLQGDNGCISLGNDFFYISYQSNGTALRADGVTEQSTYGAQARIYSLSRHHGAWKFTRVTSW